MGKRLQAGENDDTETEISFSVADGKSKHTRSL